MPMEEKRDWSGCVVQPLLCWFWIGIGWFAVGSGIGAVGDGVGCAIVLVVPEPIRAAMIADSRCNLAPPD